MRNVLVRDRNDMIMDVLDTGSGDVKTSIMINMDAETLKNLLDQKTDVSRFYDTQQDHFKRIRF